MHPLDRGLAADVDPVRDGGLELDHAIIQIVVILREEGAAPRIGMGLVGSGPFLLEGGIREDASLGIAHQDAGADVFLDGKSVVIRGAGSRGGIGALLPVGVARPRGGGVSPGCGLRHERQGFLKRGTGRLAWQGHGGGGRPAGDRGGSGYRGSGGGGGGSGSGRRSPGGGGRLGKGKAGEAGAGGEEDEKAFHQCKGDTILRRSILKSERRWTMDGGENLRGTDPWEAARRLSHLPELVFLDSALARPGAVSRIAAAPEEVIEGSGEADWQRLRRAISGRTGGPGMVAGYFEYEGRFRVGVYPRVLTYLHDEGRWIDEGGLAGMMGEDARLEEEPIAFKPEMHREAYEAMVQRAQEYIASGDIYQVNLAHRFSARWSGRLSGAMGYYGRLRACSPAPYSALILADRVIASSSPELFLAMEGREVVTRPIKGTRARGGDAASDAAAAAELGASAKERAELVMITDLERNDLGQVCDYGTVEVRELLKLERYAQVHHMVSTVRGRLRAGVDHLEALRACFPGGSVTGAPKRRAREIIAELERGGRGVYTGAIGWIGFDGRSAFNIAIRTTVLERDGAAHFHAGAGIVADSLAAREWEETLWKAGGMMRAGEAPASAPEEALRGGKGTGLDGR